MGENQKNESVSEDVRCKKEYKRLVKLLNNAGVDQQKIKIIDPIIENTAWMKIKLDDARATCEDSEIVIEYDNGGNQRGIRENPIFKSYEALWKSYMQGMSSIIDCMPDSVAEVKKEETEKPINMLDVIRARKQA